MTVPDTAALAARITTALRAVPGVATLFPPHQAVRLAVGQAVAPEETRSPVRLVRSGTRLRVEVALGVGPTGTATQVLRDSREAARRVLDDANEVGAQLRCTVVLIDDPGPSPLGREEPGAAHAAA